MIKWLATLVATHNRQELEQGLAWLYSHVKPFKRSIFGLLGLSLIASGLVLFQPWLTKTLIDEGLLAKDFSKLTQIALLMIGVGIFSTALSGVNRYLHTRLSGRILFSLRNSLYQHLLKLSPAFYARWRIGDIFSRIDGDLAEIQRFAVDSLFSAISSIIGLIGALILLVTLSWRLSLLVLILLPIELLWLRWMRRKVEVHARALRERSTDMSAFLVETLPAVKFVQASVQEEREQKRLKGLGGSYLSQLLRLQVVEFFTQAIPNTLISITRAVAFLIGGYWVIQGQWQLGALIAFSTYLGMVVGPAQSLLGLYVAIQRMTVSLSRVTELTQAEADLVKPNGTQVLAARSPGEIKFEQVSFNYPERTQPILQQANALFKAGQKIALVGDSGVGKSTLIDLLQCFYMPTQGRILVDGVDIQSLELAAYRQRIAVVSQDTVLFKGSLADNLRYVAPAASDEQLLAALHQAQLGELLNALPLGINSPLGERGQQLSGGQKQRIAIARALLQQPVLVVLDEATSAVDEATEQKVVQQVDSLFAHCTRIYISHRSSTWEHADAVWKLENQLLQQIR